MKVVQETRFEYKGFPCVVLFTNMGHRCGYVGLPMENKYYTQNYDDIPIDCHGGLTYASFYLSLQEETNLWWIGFDTAHCFDKSDFEKAKEYFKDEPEVMKSILFSEELNKRYDIGGEVRSLEYCIEECKNIVDQITA